MLAYPRSNVFFFKYFEKIKALPEQKMLMVKINHNLNNNSDSFV